MYAAILVVMHAFHVSHDVRQHSSIRYSSSSSFMCYGIVQFMGRKFLFLIYADYT
jgi:hypothetical protein